MYNYKTKLNLGCGDRYLNGFTNIDFPESDTIQKRKRQPDIIDDFTKLEYPNNYFEEIHLYHVFEHFMRHEAIGLMCRFNKMLVRNGVLIIAVPNVLQCMRDFSGLNNPRDKQLIRHMWGSHEAEWAVHKEGWYYESLKDICICTGYETYDYSINNNMVFPEIKICGKKVRNSSKGAIKEFLKPYDYGDGMLDGWMTYINRIIDK